MAASRLESRFVLNALVPTLVFLPLICGTIGEAIWGLDAILSWYVALPPALIVLVPLGFLAVAWLVASLVASQWDRLVTLFEGYPLVSAYEFFVRYPVVGAIADLVYIPGKIAHQKRRSRMSEHDPSDQAAAFDLHLAYTEHEEHLLPTRLGNVLRAAELYPHSRYGIDITVLWTRLALLLPEHLLRDIERSIMQYQLPLVISAWATALACASLTLVWAGEIGLFYLVFIPACLTGVAGYYWSIPSAEHYGIALRSAFDVHRDLLHNKWSGILTAHLDSGDFERLRRFIVTGSAKRPSGTTPDAQTRSEPQPAAEPNTLRAARFKPCRLPRLRIVLAFMMVLTVVGAWRWVTTSELLVAVAAHRSETFAELTVTTERVSLYDAGGRAARVDDDVASEALVSLSHIDKGDVLHPTDYLIVPRQPTFVVGISEPDLGQADPPLQTGDEIGIVLAGVADFVSDPACRKSSDAGVERVIIGQILIPPDDAGRTTVGTSDIGAVPLRCYALEGVTLLRRIPATDYDK